MSFKKHRKIFYVPGMISLVVLPILFLWFLYFSNSFKEYSCIELGLADKKSYYEILNEFDFPNLRNYKIFVFNNTLEKEKNNLINFQKSLKIQNKFKDTINGIKLQFGKKMTYEVYIRILDILQSEKTPTYIEYQNYLWILNGNQRKEKANQREKEHIIVNCGTSFYTHLETLKIEAEEKEKANQREKEHIIVNCGTSFYTHLETLKIEAEEKEKEKNELLLSFYKKVWFLYLAYLGIIILNIFVLLKFNRNRKYNQKSYL
jgi:hypothetical protein